MGKGFSKGLGLVVANNPVRETLKHKAIVYMLVRYFWRRNQHSLPIFVPISTISKCTTAPSISGEFVMAILVQHLAIEQIIVVMDRC